VVVTYKVTIYGAHNLAGLMGIAVDPLLASFVGSTNRLLTLAVLANADEPLTGYRVAKIANLPRQKVYPELRRSIESGLVRKTTSGFTLTDADVRILLRKRVRIRWDEEWDRARWAQLATPNSELAEITQALRGTRLFDPENRIPAAALRELERVDEKNRTLRKYGARPSKRKD
jgi:hypothetical protein